MHDISLLILMLLAVIALAALAQRAGISYPIVLLVGGIVAGWVPGMPDVRIDPDLALVIFLAPVLFQAGITTSWRDFRANIVSIGMLAIGAVLLTMILVGASAHLLLAGLPWAVALTLGAIVAPPDAVAATSVFQRVGVPRRMRTIVEGESLVNDASALIAYQYAVAAVVSGHFSMRDALAGFALTGVLSVLGGLVIGWLLTRLLPLINDPYLTVALTVIVPMPVYIVADAAQLSGVLAVVAAAIVLGHSSTQAMSPRSRLGSRSVWSTLLVVLNGLVFLLIGLEFVELLRRLSPGNSVTLLWKGLLLSGIVILARFAWVCGANLLFRMIPRWRDQTFPWRMVVAVSWSGLRGIVSVATALALPLTLGDSSRFAWRDEVVFIAVVIVVVTLLGQGLTLPWLLRTLEIEPGNEAMREEWIARREAARAALDHLDTVADELWVDPAQRKLLRFRYRHWLEVAPENGELPERDQKRIDADNRLRNNLLDAARAAVVAARDRGEIGDDARLAVEAELDLEDERTIL